MRLQSNILGWLVGVGVFFVNIVFASNSFAQTGAGQQFGLQNGIDAVRKKGFDHVQAGEWPLADKAFEKALAIEPKDALSLYGRSLALFNLKRLPETAGFLDEAIEILTSGTENKPLLADSLVLSSVILAVQNQNSLAIERLKKAVEIVPGHFDANLSLGRAYFGDGRIDNAVAAFRRAVAINPEHIRARFFLATALERSDKASDALEEYRAILKLNPKSVEGNLGLGVLLLKTEGERSAAGLTALQTAVEQDPNLYEGRITLGRSLVRVDRADEAIRHLKKAAEIAPNNPEPHFQLAIAYRRLGKKNEADAESEIVKRIHEGRRGHSPLPK